MFSSAIKVKRGFCSCCQKKIEEVGKLYVLDIRASDWNNPFSGNFTPSLVESEADFAACLKCWSFIGKFIGQRVRIQEYA